jgi:uncharacterized protein
MTPVLLVVGLVILLFVILLLAQRRRRNTPPVSPTRSRPRRILIGALKLIGFTVITFVIIAGTVMLYLDDQTVTADLTPTPSQVEIPDDLAFQVEEVTFQGGDDLTLAGWFTPPQNGATIILLHGYGGNRTAMIWHAQTLVEAGYGVLMYDERASGESAGQRRSFGWEDPVDVGGALRYLSERPEVDAQRIGIAGCSIGGQIALQATARYPEIKAVWADGPAIVRAADQPPPDNWATGLAKLSSNVIDLMYVSRLQIEAPPPLIDIIGTIAPRPIMLIGGGTPLGEFGSEEPYMRRYAQQAGENATVWIVPEAIHCDGPVQRPDEYATRLVAFFDTAFNLK